MENFGLKFSLYDFFGYFIPGFVSILLILLAIFFSDIYGDKNTDGKLISSDIKNEYSISNLSDKIFIILNIYKDLFLKIKFVLFIPIVIITYIFGHIIYSVSMVVLCIIDRIPCFFNYKSKLNKLFCEIIQKNKINIDKKYISEDFYYISYVIKKNSELYHSRIFVFLTFYGMALGLGIIFFVFTFIFLIINNNDGLIFMASGISLLFFALSFYEFYLFRNYYIKSVFSSYLVSDFEK
ncbi:MAG: hypothetical protein KA885_01550 [Spirochaetes bacterium]|nr:hypothetical protein [Spirochaetota bacterium]